MSQANNPSFYTTGGTLGQDAPSYVERSADRELLTGLVQGEFCYVLTSRQMGKSSLMVRTVMRLKDQGVNVAALDLTAIGQNLTPEQWYDGLIMRLGRQLRLENEIEDFWLEGSRVGPVQRFFAAIHDVVLAKRQGQLVIFVDEIDTVRSLPFSTDEFFAAIRECYNRRSDDPEFKRLTFCLLGVATPSDLIRDTRTTPFNIGKRVELCDFTPDEAMPLARGLALGIGGDNNKALQLLNRVIYWTGGHPYLTQRFCRTIAEANGADSAAKVVSLPDVDRICHDLFLSNRARERDDNLLFVRERLLRSEVDIASLLDLYGKVHQATRSSWNSRPIIDDETNPLISVLRLSGITRAVHGRLLVRNTIYQRVFDQTWVAKNMPDAEIRRQREAFRKGLMRGAVVVGSVAIAAFLLSSFIKERFRQLEERQAVSEIGTVYKNLTSYEDDAEILQNILMDGGARVTTSTRCQLAFQKPNKLAVDVQVRLGVIDYDAILRCDGETVWVYIPTIKQYIKKPAPKVISSLMGDLKTIGVEVPGGVYDLIGLADPRQYILRHSTNMNIVRKEILEGEEAFVLEWQEPAPVMDPPPLKKVIPVTAWLSADSGRIMQVTKDFTGIITKGGMPNSSGGATRRIDVKEIVFSMRHRNARLNHAIEASRFSFRPSDDAKEVDRIDNAAFFAGRSNEQRPRFSNQQLSEMIPQRDPTATLQMVDLSRFYNAPLTRPWHSEKSHNNLSEMPRGIQTFGGVSFDVRGIVQLAGRAELYLTEFFPAEVSNIPVKLKCRRLHFLHSTGWETREGEQIGSYVIHYADGQKRIFPITYGFEVSNWWSDQKPAAPTTGLMIAWEGSNPASREFQKNVRVYKSEWENPLPDAEIKSIDFTSSMREPAPFLIAITAD